MIIDNQKERVAKWVCDRAGGNWECCEAIGLERRGELVGGVIFDNYNGANIAMHCASDGTKRWLDREFLWFVFYYPFKQLGVRRITSPISEKNIAAQRFIENIGFELETTLQDAHPDGDLLIYRMTPAMCRWLSLKGKI